MAKSCIACGKNIGLLGVRVPLLGTEDLVICSDCFDKIPPVINELYQKRLYPTKSELLTIKDDVIVQLKASNHNQDTINVVTKFLDDKIARAKDPENSEDGKLLKKCPVCKKNVNYDTEICSDCGFAFNVVDVMEYQEIAKIYNARLEQIKKNPKRYSSIKKYIENCADDYAIIECVFESDSIGEEKYYWIDQAPVTEQEYNSETGWGFNHWYEVAELFEAGKLPFDLTDEDTVSIFGTNKFVAFADLSYGC